MNRTDALITDYSSVAIDYLLLDKPIGFTLDDFEEYRKTRGFIFEDPKKYMPGHHIYSFSDLCDFLSSVSDGYDPFWEQRASVRLAAHNKPTSTYCEEVLRYFGFL